jgi:membrane-bound serine protease (ClpP class)
MRLNLRDLLRIRSVRRIVRTLAVVLVAVGAAGTLPPLLGQSPPSNVFVVPVDGTIDLGLAPFLARSLREAHDAGAAAVVLEINTFGGRVDAAVAMRDTLLASPVRTIAFVNQRAISAGALIALACDTIVMGRAATIGAATPVQAGVGPPQPTDEKTVSYVRKEFAATAEARGRPPLFAEAMVDTDVEIAGVVEKGKLLTLSTSEALKHKVADVSADTLEDALAATGLPGAAMQRMTESWAEHVVRVLTGPVISSLLMSLGLLGLLVEIRTPGFGAPGAVGLLSLGLFLWGHWIVQLAGWEELMLLAVGAALLLVEALVLPGFGVAGVAGIVACVAALGLTLVGQGATLAVFVNALGRVAISLLVAIGGWLLLLRFLPTLPFGRRLILSSAMRSDLGYASPPARERGLVGRRGTTLSPLRPAGIADIDGHRVDVVSDGEFVEAGRPIRVTQVDGNRVVVRVSAEEEPPHE